MSCRSLFLPGLLAFFGWSAEARADLLLTLDDDGAGGTLATLTGTFDVSDGDESTSNSSTTDRFASGPFDSLFLERRSTPAAVSRSVRFGTAAGAGPILGRGFGTLRSDLVVDDFALNIRGGGFGFARLTTYDGAYAGTLNETLDFSNAAFSSFNPGTYDFGNFGGDANDGIRLQIGPAAVPEPSCLALLTFGGLACFVRRKVGRGK